MKRIALAMGLLSAGAGVLGCSSSGNRGAGAEGSHDAGGSGGNLGSGDAANGGSTSPSGGTNGATGGSAGSGAGGDSGSGGSSSTSKGCAVEAVAPTLNTPTDGLLDEWRFEGDSDRAVVETTHQHDGFLRKAVWRRGKFGNALKLYGLPESRAEVPNFDTTLGGQFTISLWLQTTDKYTIGQEYQPAPKHRAF